MSFLNHPIGKQIDGDDRGGRFDYSHLLTPEQRGAGYTLELEHGDGDDGVTNVSADILHNGDYVGGVRGDMGEWRKSLVDPRQRHRSLNIELADLDDAHQGKGLGPAAWKAMVLHGRNVLGATHLECSEYSSMAHRVHEKICSELGVVYHPKPNIGGNGRAYKDEQEWKAKPSGAYDRKYKDFKVPLEVKKAESESWLQDLQKAVNHNDFSAVAKSVDDSAKGLVDHTHQLKSHPETMDPHVGFYQQTFLDSPSIVRKVKSPRLGGISKKVVFNAPGKAEGGEDQWYMVKPYHEKVTRSVKSWMDRPTQGWAEMTNQSLFHAAGIGHMHQKVHVAEHNMGPGHENEPGVVIHMQPGMDEVHSMTPQHWHPSILHDATKIAAMDYLSNNLDRHGANLLVRKPEKHDPNTHASRLLAIDHGRNFQYKAKTKWGKEELEMGAPPESLLEDSLGNYLGNNAIQQISHYSASDGGLRVSNPQHFVDAIQHWWPGVRTNVVHTMHHQLKGLTNQDHRSHIWKNFMERVEKLDEICRFPDEYIDGDRSMLHTPIYPAAETKNAYNPWKVE